MQSINEYLSEQGYGEEVFQDLIAQLNTAQDRTEIARISKLIESYHSQADLHRRMFKDLTLRQLKVNQLEVARQRLLAH